MNNSQIIGLFDGVGIELEYMCVDKSSLKVNPIVDKIFYELANEYVSDYEFDNHVVLSNELVMHVIELKTNGPATSVKPYVSYFQVAVNKINEILSKYNSTLMPSAMHPLMEPVSETKLWPYDSSEIYQAYNKIFNCQGHGWSNLQSIHINLPFKDDDEFSRLHAAIRLILPIIPAIAASSPIVEGKVTGFMDTRLEYYRQNQKVIPQIAGDIIPEAIFSIKEYKDKILNLIYEAIRPFDPDGILQHEWLNSRGAIARFARNTIEIRVIDIQESVLADLAVASAIISAVYAMIEERWIPYQVQKQISTSLLKDIFLQTIKDGSDAIITNDVYIKIFNLNSAKTYKAIDIWKKIIHDINNSDNKKYCIKDFENEINIILNYGSLAKRILKKINNNYELSNIQSVYQQLSHSLASSQLFF